MNSREIVRRLLEADQPSAGDNTGVYVFGPKLPAEGYGTHSVETAIEQFRRSGIIPAETRDSPNLLDQLVHMGYTFFLKKSQDDVEVIGRVPAQTSPEGQEQAAQYLGLDQKARVQYRRTPTATPTSVDAQTVLYGSKEMEPQPAQARAKPRQPKQADWTPLDAPVQIGMTFDTGSKDGVHVMEVHPSGPSAQAGMQAGDVIVQAGKFARRDNGESKTYAIQTPQHLEYVLRVADPQHPIPFKVIRGAAQHWLPILPTARQQQRAQRTPEVQAMTAPPRQQFQPNQPPPTRETGNRPPNVSSLS